MKYTSLRSVLYYCVVFCLGFSLAAPAARQALAADDIGKVIAYASGASVPRNGKTETLAMHAGIQVSDTISTDASGRVKVLFNDDSAVSIGPNTTMEMGEYADAGNGSAFGVHVPQGVLRVITGKIVDQNPNGFKITTPEAVISIRGTIVSLRTGGGYTTVYVENTLRRVYVNDIYVPSGSKITLPGNPPVPEPITPEDRRQLGRDLAFRGGMGIAAAAPEPDDLQRSSAELFPSGQSRNLMPDDTYLTDIAMNVQREGDNLLDEPIDPGNPIDPGKPIDPGNPTLIATVSGPLTTSMVSGNIVNANASNFSFDVELATGDISNGRFHLETELAGSTVVYIDPNSTPVITGSGWVLTADMTDGVGSVVSNTTNPYFIMEFDKTGTGTGTVKLDAATASFLLNDAFVHLSGDDDPTQFPVGTNPLLNPVLYNVTDGMGNPLDDGRGNGNVTIR